MNCEMIFIKLSLGLDEYSISFIRDVFIWDMVLWKNMVM